MPIVQVSLLSGRSPQQLRTLIRDVTAAVSRAVDAPVDTIRVLVTEVPPTLWGSGDQTIAERRQSDPMLTTPAKRVLPDGPL